MEHGKIMWSAVRSLAPVLEALGYMAHIETVFHFLPNSNKHIAMDGCQSLSYALMLEETDNSTLFYLWQRLLYCWCLSSFTTFAWDGHQ